MQIHGFAELSPQSGSSKASSLPKAEESFAQSLADSTQSDDTTLIQTSADSDSLLESFSSLRDLLSLERLLGFTPENGDAVSIVEIKRHGQQQLEEANQQLLRLYHKEGIDTDQEIALVRDTTGRWQVSNGHPDTAKIESLLAEERELCQQMARAQGLLHLAAIAEMTEPFREAYAQDAKAAVARYGWIWNSRWSDTVIQSGGSIWHNLTRAA